MCPAPRRSLISGWLGRYNQPSQNGLPWETEESKGEAGTVWVELSSLLELCCYKTLGGNTWGRSFAKKPRVPSKDTSYQSHPDNNIISLNGSESNASLLWKSIQKFSIHSLSLEWHLVPHKYMWGEGGRRDGSHLWVIWWHSSSPSDRWPHESRAGLFLITPVFLGLTHSRCLSNIYWFLKLKTSSSQGASSLMGRTDLQTEHGERM